MVLGSPALRGRLGEILEEREGALASAFSRRPQWDGLTCRLSAASVVAVHRVLVYEVLGRTANGEPKDPIRTGVAPVARRAFDQLQQMLPDANDQA